MNREIKIINFVFKHKDKINLLSIEEYRNYNLTNAKIKLLYENEYFEKEVEIIGHDQDKLVYGDLIIEKEQLECYIGKHHIVLKIDNNELFEEFMKASTNKNNYKLLDINTYFGIVNDVDVSGKCIVDYEIIKLIPDEYYKIYALDFINFSGMFTMLMNDDKGINLSLSYKDEEFKNKKPLKVCNVEFFKLSNVKLKISGNYYWKVNISNNKTYRSNPSVIPFKYQKGTLKLEMKKNLFKTNLKAETNDVLLITYKFK